MRILPHAVLLLLLLPLSANAAQELRLIGVSQIATEAVAGGMRIGGLSGIDYDAKHDRFLAISDDKSEFAPARFLAVKLAYDVQHVGSPTVTETVVLRDSRGETYPQPGTGKEALDSESLRLEKQGTLLITTEGDTKDGFGPAIRRFDCAGKLLETLALPPQLTFDPAQERGPRTNLSLEGLSFTPDPRVLWAGMEAPLFQDSALPSLETGAPVRFLRRTGAIWQQFIYNVDPLQPGSEGRLADNGVSEILALDAQHLLVLERAGIRQGNGDFRFFARLYCASLAGASDVSALASLKDAPYRPMRKTLLLNFAAYDNPYADNVEGISFGRHLANGHESLVFVTDNNFSATHQTQFWVFDAGRRKTLLKMCAR